jgi:hypothetical protein
MAAIQSTAIPRFLLPRLTWGSGILKPTVCNGPFEARRQPISTNASPPLGQPGFIRSPWTSPIRHPVQAQARLAVRPVSIAAAQRCFSATACQSRDHHFDTLKFVQRLKDEGFTTEQAEAMMRVLSDVIEERLALASRWGIM